MRIVNREIPDVTAVMEVNLVTLTMAIMVTVQRTCHPHHHLQMITAVISRLAAHLDLRAAVMTEMGMVVVAEGLHHPHQHYLLSHNRLKALHLPNKATPLATAMAETAASKAMTIIVARAVVATEVQEEGTMAMAEDIDAEVATTMEDAGKVDTEEVASNKETKHKDRTKDVRRENEEVRANLVVMKARGEDSRFCLCLP